MTEPDARTVVTDRRRTQDRRRQRRFHFFDRRTGFDRRKLHPILGTMSKSAELLLFVLVLVNLLSALDGALTLFEIRTGLATEGNPILGGLFSISPALAASFKLAVIGLVSLGIWRWRRYRAVVAVALFALALYTAVVAYHAGNLWTMAQL